MLVVWLLFCLVVSCMCASSATGQVSDQSSANPRIGRTSCAAATCHGGVVDSGASWHSSSTIWEARDPHARAGLQLQNELSRQIVHALVPQSQSDNVLFQRVVQERCTACHAPDAALSPGGQVTARGLAQGVSCEACHGAAGKWLDVHTQEGFVATDARSLGLGMLNTQQMSSRVERCANCHVGSRTAEGLVRDVNHDMLAAGHPRLVFDPLVMESKLPAHWSTTAGSAMVYSADQLASCRETARKVVLESFAKLKAERQRSLAPLPRPEFSEFDCRACHRELTSTNRVVQPVGTSDSGGT